MGDADINTLKMEQYLTLTRGNQALGVVKPEIGGNVNFEIKSQFLRELREDTFSRNKNDNAYEHIERILDIISLFNILGVTHDAVMLRLEEIHNFKQEGEETLYQAWERYNDLLYKYPTHDLNSHQKVNIFYKGLDTMTHQLLDSQGLIPNKTPTQALDAIQTMADHSQKWHNRLTSRKDAKTVEDLALTKNVRLMKRLKALRKSSMENLDDPFQIITGTIPDIYMEELDKKEAEHYEWLRKFQESIEINQRGHDEIICNLESKEETEEVKEMEEVAAQHELTHQKESQDEIDYRCSKLDQENPWGIKAIEEPNIERDIDLSLVIKLKEHWLRYGKVCKMTKERIMKDYWRHSFDENHDDMIDMSVDPTQEINPNTEEDCKNLENFGEEKMGLILDTVLDKLDDDIDDEAYKERMCEMLDMTYRKPPPIFIEKVEGKVCKMTKERILKDYWRQEFDENQDDMIDMNSDLVQEISPNTKEDCEDLENFGEEKMELILDVVLDKLDNGWFSRTVKDEEDLDGIVDYSKLKSHDGFIDIDDEAYKERM
ncbi:hypothetical protein Tco_0725286 [Tanacetum coccineum]|uniref:Uncharacterized protein n=1 Tax=Tanacetum coccineum TaxID=301880 RepID=A0ABQ4YCG7_9ASTR